MILSKKAKEGYLLIDNRLAPPEPGTVQFLEAAVKTCSHCQRQVAREIGSKQPRYWCPTCDNYICNQCEADRLIHGCKTWEAKLVDHEKIINRARMI